MPDRTAIQKDKRLGERSKPLVKETKENSRPSMASYEAQKSFVSTQLGKVGVWSPKAKRVSWLEAHLKRRAFVPGVGQYFKPKK